jgi:predicted ATPase
MAVPYYLALKAEALYLARRTSRALEAINEAEAVAERREERWWSAELHRLSGGNRESRRIREGRRQD